MAMGQGEQRGIHAFFTKDFGVPTPVAQPLENGLLCPTTSHEANGSPALQTPPVAALDHDPNTDRRKRRKTSKDVEESSGNDIVSTGGGPIVEGVSGSAEDGTALTSTELPRTFVEVEIPSPPPERDSLQRSTETMDPAPAEPEQQKKQKVIKLNANGKLLSSPNANKFADMSKKGTKRGKSAPQHPDIIEKKLVVIKYIDKDGSSQNIGRQIDEILSGRRRHTISKRAARQTTTIPAAATVKQQPKATHPFFLKKTAQKSEVPSSHAPRQDSVSPPAEARSTNPESAHSRPLFKPSPFRHGFAKVPEPMHPLWPPSGLIHVRDFNDRLDLGHDDCQASATDYKKSKAPAVQVNYEESVLSFLGSSSDILPALREPSRQVISGRVLQAKVGKLMRQRASSDTDEAPSRDALHPAVAKLYDSLPSSMSAFDRGDYEAQLWAHKYAPSTAQQVLCGTKEALMLRDWLNHLVVSSVDMGNSSKDNEKSRGREEKKKRKRRKKADKLDDFIVSSEDEYSEMGEISGSDDELAGDVTVSNKRTVIRTGDLTFNLRSSNDRGRMTNAILLSGPSGCGKTASVYAVAKEMDFEVFEINAGSRRSAKDILDRIGDMAQNHLVHNLHDKENLDQPSGRDSQAEELQDTGQNKLMGFFKPTSTAKKTGRPQSKAPPKESAIKQSRTQKQSLILLEEADILFEEDKQFWSGVLALINQSKRPIVITCNDESLIPLDDISFHAILRYRALSTGLAVDYLLLLAANEGHILERTAVERLYSSTGNDLRQSIMELNYWCQMAVGSDKSGLDWIIDRWPQGVDLDSNGDKLRMLSTGTYDDYMGWFSRDIMVNSGLATETELREEALHWWHLSLQEADILEDMQFQPSSKPRPTLSKLENLEGLRLQSEYMESRSVLDVLAVPCSLDARMDAIDASVPPILEKQKLNFADGYQLLHTDRVPDYTTLTLDIGSNFQALLGRTFRQTREADLKDMLASNILEAVSKPKADKSDNKELLKALIPAMKPDCGFPPPGRGAELAFEHGQRSIVEDLTPYVRSIVAFDLRLENYRRELSGLLSGNTKGTKRMRTTRASRAALEGCSKAETRKERWFSPAMNVQRILATGNREWQDLLVQSGHFTVPEAEEQASRERNEPISGSTSDGSI
ncbi:hypothetical protein BDV10DRAFT_166805 [Aspergillus recurvatus]